MKFAQDVEENIKSRIRFKCPIFGGSGDQEILSSVSFNLNISS